MPAAPMAPSAPHTLADLGQHLLHCAAGALLDARLDLTSEQVPDELARELLRGAYEAGDAHTLRELLHGARLERWVSETCTEREEQALRAQLKRWLGLGHAGADDPARLVTLEAPPAEREALMDWARRHGVHGELQRPACEVLPARLSMTRDLTLAQAWLGGFEADVRGASLLSGSALEAAARTHLLSEAAALAAPGARERLWQRPLPEPPLRALSERLQAAVADTELQALHAVHFVPAHPVNVAVGSGVARAALRGEDGHPPFGVKLMLSGFEQRALEGVCERCRRPRCIHVRALAARLFDACLVQEDALHEPLLQIARVPSWKRFMQALQPQEGDSTEASARLCFRVRLADGNASVGVSLQKPLVGGGFSAGKLVSPQRMLRSRRCNERDRPVLEALSLATRTLSAQFLPADMLVLRSLVEHPGVVLDDGGEALRISEQTLQVTLLEQGDGLLPKVSLADHPVHVGSRRPGASYALHHDRATQTLVIAALTPPLTRLLAALADFRGVLPPQSYPLLAPWLASVRQVAQVSAPKALAGSERPTPRKLLLRISAGVGEGIQVSLTMRALPLGPLWPPGQGPELTHGFVDGQQVFTRRDLAWEHGAGKHVLSTLALHTHTRIENFSYHVQQEQGVFAVLSAAARLTDVLEIEWAESARRRELAGSVHSGDLKLGFSASGQWFALSGGARVNDADLAIGRLLNAARRGERFVSIGGDSFVEIEQELFGRLQQAQLCVNNLTQLPAISAAAAPFWLQQLGAQSSASDATTRQWLERARASHLLPEPSAPGAAWAEGLRDYQRAGVAWLLQQSGWAPGVCLADEMGLGKTVQTIALLRERSSLGAALVIAPTSVVPNWLAELARFAPQLRAQVYQGGTRAELLSALGSGSVLITSYELVLRDRELLAAHGFATQVIDEAQTVKNARTLRARAVLGMQASFRVALTGTPVENRLGDIWSLFELIAPGLLGSWAMFRARFAVPIERYDNQERAAVLRALIAPFMLRRTKREVATELPSRTEVVQRVELSAAEQDLYDGAVRDARRALSKRREGDGARSMRILAELTRLRLLACHPRLVLEDERIESSKLAALMQLLQDILPRGHRALIFSQFTRHLALVRDALDAAAIRYVYLDGSTPAGQRKREVDRFQGGEDPVFLISLKAGGTGLNLTAADYVIHLDPWWNPAAEDQASDRAHRLGQLRPLTIIKLVAQDTIEEKVLALHDHKRKLANSVLSGDATASSVDAQMLEELLLA
jgi:superfamily II DNA or RNA helicase